MLHLLAHCALSDLGRNDDVYTFIIMMLFCKGLRRRAAHCLLPSIAQDSDIICATAPNHEDSKKLQKREALLVYAIPHSHDKKDAAMQNCAKKQLSTLNHMYDNTTTKDPNANELT